MADIVTIVHVVDDDQSVLKSLGRLLAMAGHRFETYSSAEDFLRKHDPDIPGCAVLDLEMPGIDGIGVQERLMAGSKARPVIFLTGRGTVPASVKAIKAGAVDFLTKPVDASTFLSTVAIALERDIQARRHAEELEAIDARIRRLTPREREILDHILAGRLNKQIAGDLGIAERTVKLDRSRLMEKIGARTVTDLVRLVARRQG
jgi:FixJ family two-component response regulator